jgi:hypothetical protein
MIVGPTTKLCGSVVNQDNQPVAYCPLVCHWEHRVAVPWTEFGHSEVIMSDEAGNWEIKRRGIHRIFVKIGKDCNQRYFPGYTPGNSDEEKQWIVGGTPREIRNPYIISVVVDRKAAVKPYTPSSQDYLADQYQKLRKRYPVLYSEIQTVEEGEK